ncbi:hypothetical protein GCM10007301_09240 [Azorhizobium oxalatiphilum]|uniref:Core domain-containing protein n=1 Tax=Azorhizobium oxalatiphilum TaxID=980631 RepID=A0A917BPK9_9HYPH|nr:iron-sulfur cluster assembly accessory protein [Azorhizobium oxalatiphilum]GGF51949.1 hypothetical protein GCM10007301_09240 [Azorhizobium oxalatiphilum]
MSLDPVTQSPQTASAHLVPPFEMTRAAARFIRMMLLADGDATSGFRLVLSPGGCSGLSADMSVCREPRTGDAVVERDGVRLFLPAESRLLLAGVTIDFSDSLAQTGLVFRDPRNTGTCSSHASPIVTLG